MDGYQYPNKDQVRMFKCNESEQWEFVEPVPKINDQYLNLDVGSYQCEGIKVKISLFTYWENS